MSWTHRKWRLKQHWATLGDIDKRDKLLWYLCKFLHRNGITANCITLLGFLLLLDWVILYELAHIRNYWVDSIFFALISLSDFIDGPTARNNDNVTWEGTLADYTRDLFFVFYICRVGYDYGLPWDYILAVVAFEFVAIGIKAGHFFRYNKGRNRLEVLSDFCLDNFQGEFEDRYQFGAFCFAVSLFMTAGYLRSEWWFNTATALFWISIGMGIFVVAKEWKWKPQTEEIK